MENSEEMKERQFKQSDCWSYGNLASGSFKMWGQILCDRSSLHLLLEPACNSISNLHPEVRGALNGSRKSKWSAKWQQFSGSWC